MLERKIKDKNLEVMRVGGRNLKLKAKEPREKWPISVLAKSWKCPQLHSSQRPEMPGISKPKFFPVSPWQETGGSGKGILVFSHPFSIKEFTFLEIILRI